MKKLLLSLAVFASLATSAQCVADYDFGDEPFGVSPDPILGESFELAEINVPYSDVIHIMVPTSAADIDPTFPQAAPIDSIILTGVTLIDDFDGMSYAVEDLGLNIVCNNNGDSPNPCTFYGGTQYCASIEGTPTQGGNFQLVIDVIGYTTVFGIPVPQEVSFDQYSFSIFDPNSIEDQVAYALEMEQNAPNPFSKNTSIAYTLPKNEAFTFRVSNLLGEVVFSENLVGQRGKGAINFNGSKLQAGIYLYSIETSKGVLTKRLIINR